MRRAVHGKFVRKLDGGQEAVQSEGGFMVL